MARRGKRGGRKVQKARKYSALCAVQKAARIDVYKKVPVHILGEVPLAETEFCANRADQARKRRCDASQAALSGALGSGFAGGDTSEHYAQIWHEDDEGNAPRLVLNGAGMKARRAYERHCEEQRDKWERGFKQSGDQWSRFRPATRNTAAKEELTCGPVKVRRAKYVDVQG